MRTRLIIVACVALLGGAWWVSRSLVDEVPVVPTNADSLSFVQRPAVLEPVPEAPTTPPLSGAKLDAVINSQPQGPVQPSLSDRPTMKEATPPVDDAPSPYQGESRELDYAEELILEPVRDEARLNSALGVLKRCLEQEPNNQRCLTGLEQVKLRLYPPPATTLPPPAPTFQVPPSETLHQRR